MHELSLCESVLQIIQHEAAKQGYSQVKTVWLEVGKLSCVAPEALHFAFESVMRNTLAANAKLEIIPVAGRARCDHCGHEQPVNNHYDVCSNCNSYNLDVIAGKELRIKELEVE